MSNSDEIFKKFKKRIDISVRGLEYLHKVSKEFVDNHYDFREVLDQYTVIDGNRLDAEEDYVIMIADIMGRLVQLSDGVRDTGARFES